jgi:hypothetical protein
VPRRFHHSGFDLAAFVKATLDEDLGWACPAAAMSPAKA